jgi:endonuclease YncB( thermonuclease family)
MSPAKRPRPRVRALLLSALALAAVVVRLAPLRTSAAGPRAYRVVDADTLVVRGVTIRLKGVDAPESGQTCWRNGGWWRGRQRREWVCGEPLRAMGGRELGPWRRMPPAKRPSNGV